MASPRDHVVDSNPDISRKRARLSSEEASNDVVVQALPLEDIDPDPSIISISDDPLLTMGKYSATLDIGPYHDPVQDIQGMRGSVFGTLYADTEKFLRLQEWLTAHLSATQSQPRSIQLQGYSDDENLFGEIATMAEAFLQGTKIFDPVEADDDDVRDGIRTLLVGLTELSMRHIHILPDITKEKLARRDSAHIMPGNSRSQRIPALRYVSFIAAIFRVGHTKARFFQQDAKMRLKWDEIRAACAKLMSEQPSVFDSLIAVLNDLGQHPREVDDAWIYIEAIVQIFWAFAKQAGSSAEGFVNLMNQTVLPIVCEKHPRALPQGFHNAAVMACRDALSWQLNAHMDNASHSHLIYERLVMGKDDALLSEESHDSASLDELSEGDGGIRGRLLVAAWSLQAYKNFLFSSIMDIRSIGINLLCDHLIVAYKEHCQHHPDGVAHPIIQYAARFLRKNQLTSYIFSADSHASIINVSRDIVDFLAVTIHYTHQETDIMWRACTTSVEADFVKASWNVLQHVSRNLPYDELLYLAKKYPVAAAEQLAMPNAVDTLVAVFRYLHETAPSDAQDKSILASMEVALEVLRHLQNENCSPAHESLNNIAMAELMSARSLSQPSRLQLYQKCIPAILEKDKFSTTSVEVLALFLKKGVVTNIDVEPLLAALPITAVVDELCHWTANTDQQPRDADLRLRHLRSRVTVILRMLSISPSTQVDAISDRLYEVLIGRNASDNISRNLAWEELRGAADADDAGPAAYQLLRGYLDTKMGSLPADFATPALVELLADCLDSDWSEEIAKGNADQLLESPKWKMLVRIAAGATDSQTAQGATNLVCHLLIVWPQNGLSREALARCHVQFIGGFINSIRSAFPEPSRMQDIDLQRYTQSVHLLATILQKGKDAQASLQLPSQLDTMTLEGCEGDPEAFCCSLLVRAPGQDHTVTTVKASKHSTVAELATILPKMTRVKSNRVIVGGKMVDMHADAEKKLLDLGVQPSGVLMICPVYTSSTDLDLVLTSLCPVEQELSVQYDQMERFLDGPDSVAEQTHSFLRLLRPSASARSRVCTAQAVIAENFPSDRPYRARHSAFVLKSTLRDYARLGVADQDFIIRGVRVLTACLTDYTLTFDTVTLQTIVECFTAFLQERPLQSDDEPELRYFNNPASFARRMVDILLQHLGPDVADNITKSTAEARVQVVSDLYRAFLQAVRIQPDVWSNWKEDARFQDLHAALMFDQALIKSRTIVTLIESMCGNESAPYDFVQVCWDTVLANIPTALAKPFATLAFFGIAKDLVAKQFVGVDETTMRNLFTTISEYLWHYNHTEILENAFPDECLIGLVTLLKTVVTFLKAFKRPLDLAGFAPRLFKCYLFSPEQGSSPLLQEFSRGHVYDLVMLTAETCEDYCAIAQVASTAMRKMPPGQFPGFKGFIRSPTICAGLSNLGMTCYMNSLLQQLFANISFRKLIFDVPILDTQKQALLCEVQKLFANMQESAIEHADTQDLANILQIQTDSQEDVHTFYANFIARLELCMPDKAHRDALMKLFTGKMISQVKGECGHVSTKDESFTELSVTVKNKANLLESLDEFVQGEPMQGSNRYKCSTCDEANGGRLVNAMRRMCLEEAPDNLTFCLKRFTFEAVMLGSEGKVNDRFDFPEELDMAKYHRAALEHHQDAPGPDMFDLVGVIVHSGTLEFGHYWSYVRLANSSEPSTWVYLEDRAVRPCGGVQKVLDECAGGNLLKNGQARSDNAYVLFYKRRSAAREQAQLRKKLCLPPGTAQYLPPRLELPTVLAEHQEQNTLWRWSILHVFSSQFADLIRWLSGSWSMPLPTIMDGDDVSQSQAEGPTVATLAITLAQYIVRVAVCAPSSGQRIRTIMDTLGSLSNRDGDSYSLKTSVVEHLSRDSHIGEIWKHGDIEYQDTITTFLEDSLNLMQQAEHPAYQDTIERLVVAHANLKQLLGLLHDRWSSYFGFVARIASRGAQETALVLNHGYLSVVFDILYLQWYNNEIRQRFPELVKRLNAGHLDMMAPFAFLSGLLEGRVDIVEENLDNENDYRVDGETVALKLRDLKCLTSELTLGRGESTIWALGYLACRKCFFKGTKEELLEYPPGRAFIELYLRVDLGYQRWLEKAIVNLAEVEVDELRPLLSMVLCYCQAKGENSGTLVQDFCRHLRGWQDLFGHEVLVFCEMMASFARRAAIESCPRWAPYWLGAKKSETRKGTVEWLSKHISEFDVRAEETASRLRATRLLVNICLPRLRQVYQAERPVGNLLQTLEAMKGLKDWLTAMDHEFSRIAALNTEAPEKCLLGPEVVVEWDESKRTIKDLVSTFEELDGWDMTASAPADLHSGVSFVLPKDLEAEDEEDEVEDSDALSDDYTDAEMQDT